MFVGFNDKGLQRLGYTLGYFGRGSIRSCPAGRISRPYGEIVSFPSHGGLSLKPHWTGLRSSLDCEVYPDGTVPEASVLEASLVVGIARYIETVSNIWGDRLIPRRTVLEASLDWALGIPMFKRSHQANLIPLGKEPAQGTAKNRHLTPGTSSPSTTSDLGSSRRHMVRSRPSQST